MIGTLAEGDHVVDHGRLAEQPLRSPAAAACSAPCRACLRGSRAARSPRRRCRRRRRAAPRGRSALPLPRMSSPRKPAARARSIASLQRRDRVRILASGCRCSRASRRPRGPAMVMPSISTIRVAFHDHAVGERARVALVRVADDVLLRRAGVSSTVFHLMPVGKAAPPRPRSPESVTCCDDVLAGSCPSALRRPRSRRARR